MFKRRIGPARPIMKRYLITTGRYKALGQGKWVAMPPRCIGEHAWRLEEQEVAPLLDYNLKVVVTRIAPISGDLVETTYSMERKEVGHTH